MSDKYKTVSTSKSSATVNDIELSSSTTTRKIVRPELVNNPNDSEAGVKITLLHQRKKTGDVWEDIESKPLSEMKAGETVKLSLRSACWITNCSIQKTKLYSNVILLTNHPLDV